MCVKLVISSWTYMWLGEYWLLIYYNSFPSGTSCWFGSSEVVLKCPVVLHIAACFVYIFMCAVDPFDHIYES